jgi:hypothetical protein
VPVFHPPPPFPAPRLNLAHSPSHRPPSLALAWGRVLEPGLPRLRHLVHAR